MYYYVSTEGAHAGARADIWAWEGSFVMPFFTGSLISSFSIPLPGYFSYRYSREENDNDNDHSILIGANGSGSREEGSGLACWPPSLTGEPSLTVSMEAYRSLSRWAFPIENYWIYQA